MTYNKRLLRESINAKKITKAIIAAKKTGWPEMTILRASLEVQGDRLKKQVFSLKSEDYS